MDVNIDELIKEIDFFDMNWNVVWWHSLSFFWVIFAVYVISKNTKRQFLVLFSFLLMSSCVAFLSASMVPGQDPPFHFFTTLFGFSLVLMYFVYSHAVSKKRYGPLIFRLLLLLQLGVELENICRNLDQPILKEPFEGEILEVPVVYSKKYKGDTSGNGKYNMHITCKGTGKHLVILDAGMPFWSASLSGVADIISEKYRNTTVCTYDRLGYGWSDRVRFNTRSTSNMMNELRSLLAVAKLSGKRVVYIGWSFGGLIAQLYARLFPKEMLGIILVDSMDHNVLKDDPGLLDAINEGRYMFTLSKALAPIGFMRLVGSLGLLPPECGFPLSSSLLPPQAADAMRALFYSQKHFLNAAYDELDGLVWALNVTHDLLGTPERIPSNTLTVVLRSNQSVPLPYLKSHKRLLRTSERKKEMITNNSDHYIPMRDPESILEALRALFIMRKNIKAT